MRVRIEGTSVEARILYADAILRMILFCRDREHWQNIRLSLDEAIDQLRQAINEGDRRIVEAASKGSSDDSIV